MRLNKLSIKFFLGLILLAACAPAFSQPAATELTKKLQPALVKTNYLTDTANVMLLNQLSDQYLYDKADSALYYAKQALTLAQHQKYKVGEARSWNSIGRAYYVKGDYTISLNAATTLINLSTKINYRPGIAGAHQIMGLIYLAQDKNAEARVEFNQALTLYTRLKDFSRAGRSYFDIGISYDESGIPDKAFVYLDSAIDMANRANDGNLLSMTINRKGEIYFHTKDYKKAISYYAQVTASRSASNWEVDFAYSGIAQCNYELGNYKDAVASAQKSYDMALKVNSAADEARAMEILSESYAGLKDYQNAYKWHTLFKNLNDSLFNSEKEQEVNYLHLQQQQADNKRLENDIKSKEDTIAFNNRLLFFRNMIAAATVIFVIFIIFNNRQKTKLNKLLKKQNVDIADQKEEISRQKEVLDELNRTKDQLFSVISHDLRSPFAAILQSIAAIQDGVLTAGEQAVLMEDFNRQVTLVTNMVNNLLAWANSQQAGIKSNPIRMEVTRVVNEIVSVGNFLAKNKNITIDHQPDGKKWITADADHVRIIVQNLLGNAIKFTPEGGRVDIFYSEADGYIGVHVKDNGTGISAEKLGMLFKVVGKEISGYGTNNEGGAGIGLALIKQFTDADNGKLEVKSTAGVGSEFTAWFMKDI